MSGKKIIDGLHEAIAHARVPERFFVREIIVMRDGVVTEMQVGNPLLSDPGKCWLECIPVSALAASPEVAALVAEAVAAERRAIMPEHVIRVAAMLIDALHVLDTEAVQIADATNNSRGVDGVQVLEDAEKIIKAAAGYVASELRGIAAAIRSGE